MDSHGCSQWGVFAWSCRFPHHILGYHNRYTASLFEERDGILFNPALLDTVFCIKAAFVMGDWYSRTGAKRKIARLGVDEHWVFTSRIRIGSPYEGFVKPCQAR